MQFSDLFFSDDQFHDFPFLLSKPNWKKNSRNRKKKKILKKSKTRAKKADNELILISRNTHLTETFLVKNKCKKTKIFLFLFFCKLNFLIFHEKK
jgi:hypothetical protein